MISQDDTRFDLNTAPLAVDHVTLKVHDLSRVAGFYTDALGLRLHAQTSDRVTLGTARPFLTLVTERHLAPRRMGAPGLFHTAFLLPDRADLGAWLDHARRHGIRILGAADHNVSEALYLDDPEGNGIEIYADRPLARWRDAAGRLQMPSYRLDLRSLPRDRDWTLAPDATRIGHVHLQTTDIPKAETFWTGLGFDVMARYPGGSFFGSGGYHHQIAANVWQSAGQPPRRPEEPGLSDLTLSAPVPERQQHIAPSGVTVILQPKEV